MNKYIERYVKYGVVRNEEEWRELWQLTMNVVNALWPSDIPYGVAGMQEKTKERLELFNKFNIGFCEGCLFRNVLTIMRMLHSKMDKELIASVLDVSIELVEAVEREKMASFAQR